MRNHLLLITFASDLPLRTKLIIFSSVFFVVVVHAGCDKQIRYDARGRLWGKLRGGRSQ